MNLRSQCSSVVKGDKINCNPLFAPQPRQSFKECKFPFFSLAPTSSTRTMTSGRSGPTTAKSFISSLPTTGVNVIKLFLFVTDDGGSKQGTLTEREGLVREY